MSVPEAKNWIDTKKIQLQIFVVLSIQTLSKNYWISNQNCSLKITFQFAESILKTITINNSKLKAQNFITPNLCTPNYRLILTICYSLLRMFEKYNWIKRNCKNECFFNLNREAMTSVWISHKTHDDHEHDLGVMQLAL